MEPALEVEEMRVRVWRKEEEIRRVMESHGESEEWRRMARNKQVSREGVKEVDELEARVLDGHGSLSDHQVKVSTLLTSSPLKLGCRATSSFCTSVLRDSSFSQSLFFFILTKGEEGPTLAGGSKVFLEKRRPSERPSSSPEMHKATHFNVSCFCRNTAANGGISKFILVMQFASLICVRISGSKFTNNSPVSGDLTSRDACRPTRASSIWAGGSSEVRSMGPWILLDSCRAHMTRPATRGMSRPMGGSSFCFMLSCAPAKTETKLSNDDMKSCLTAWACGLAGSPQPCFIFLSVGMKISESSCSTLFNRPTSVSWFINTCDMTAPRLSNSNPPLRHLLCCHFLVYIHTGELNTLTLKKRVAVHTFSPAVTVCC
ncbi:hypothetical protein EYF80_009984 [Liparis tanakae]|uniref:Uncharacterized protein n=1 Tax=Liparis tanakae TaxID=230148 RepID=A0A4Z2IPK8_9TELE|nr:hypothetical protein EYF80_009984 [Liparis tanakae]